MTPKLRPNPRATTHDLLPIAVLTLIAAVFRLDYLEIRSIWRDEILEPLNAATPIGDIPLRAKADDSHPSTSYLYQVALAAGDSDFALRSPPVVAGTATAPRLYCLAAPRLGRTAALFAAAILAVAGPMILLARQVRPSSLIVFSPYWQQNAFWTGANGRGRGPLRHCREPRVAMFSSII